MAQKTDFTPDEWHRLLAAPMMAGVAVTAADPSGLWGLLQESLASGGALVEAKRDPAANPLVKAVVADFESAEGRGAARDGIKERLTGKSPGDISKAAIQGLSELAAILDAKAPGDAAAFKAWLGEIARRVAEAGKEGGFLGFGGVAVSDAEKATLAEINSALGAKAVA